MYSYLRPEPDDTGDPAERDAELDTRLMQLGKEAEVRINKVFEEFVDKQVTKGQSDQEEDNTDQEDNSDEEEMNELTLENIQNNIESEDYNEESIDDVGDICGEDTIEDLNSDEAGETRDELNSSSGSLNDLLDESDDD